MPFALADELRPGAGEPDFDRDSVRAGKDAETALQQLINGEILWPLEPHWQNRKVLHPRRHELPDVAAHQVMSEQVPLVRHTRQMIRPHPPHFPSTFMVRTQ